MMYAKSEIARPEVELGPPSDEMKALSEVSARAAQAVQEFLRSRDVWMATRAELFATWDRVNQARDKAEA